MGKKIGSKLRDAVVSLDGYGEGFSLRVKEGDDV